MQAAHKISVEAYNAMAMAIAPGKSEYDILAVLNGIMAKHAAEHSFSPIVSVHGEVMHNITYKNSLKEGQLLLIDSGAESKECYASDITRTFPVSGKFTAKQKEIYDIVHRAQTKAINTVAVGVENLTVHLAASLEIAKGLTELGLMKGNPEEAVKAGAHALFLPHGIGHMLGLDVHDMEDLGDLVGYPEGEPRSSQFGLNCLRLKRELAAGWTLTIEPGIYFIPELIKMWEGEKRHADFINYAKLHDYLDFGGIRLEDDILVTDKGPVIIGGQMPIASQAVEEWMQGKIKAN
jgi:Xaa-Pro aminopeptidase